MAAEVLNLIDPATTLRLRTELLAAVRSPFWVVVLGVRNSRGLSIVVRDWECAH
jgi:hypothetical protein